METIDKICVSQIVINKSKFLSFAYPIDSDSNVSDILKTLREKYSDATHICYGYILSSPRIEKCSDDGEPAGTAGKPILESIKKKSLSNVLVAVVRYFGGVKLGAGGLVRAYTTATSACLAEAKIVSVQRQNKYKIVCPLDQGKRLLEALKTLGGRVDTCVYGQSVEIVYVGNITNDFESACAFAKFEVIGSENVWQ